MTKNNWDRIEQDRRIRKNGYEPVGVSLGEFATERKFRSMVRRRSEPQWIDGRPNLKSPKARQYWKSLIERAYRRGEQICVPKEVIIRLAAEIEEISRRPEIRRAFARARQHKQVSSHPGKRR